MNSVALGTSYGAISGVTTAAVLESDALTLSPNSSFTAQNLSVRASAAPGVGNSITITLRDDGAGTAVSCTISGASTTCTSSSTATIAGGSQLSFQMTTAGTPGIVSLMIGWEGG